MVEAVEVVEVEVVEVEASVSMASKPHANQPCPTSQVFGNLLHQLLVLKPATVQDLVSVARQRWERWVHGWAALTTLAEWMY